MFDTKLIGLKIKELRKRKKISQEKLADMVGMNHRSIVRLENSYSQPTIDTLAKISEALDINMVDFFEVETVKNRQQIVEDINHCLASMTDEELKTFYKSVYYFLH